MNICDKTYLALSLLVEASRESQKKFNENVGQSFYGGTQWSREFCTIKMSTSRGSGHTSAIFKMMEEFKSALVIFRDAAMFDVFKRHICRENKSAHIFNSAKRTLTVHREYPDEQDKIIYFSTFGSVKNMLIGSGINIEAVMVDCSFMASKKWIDGLYNLCSPIMNYSEKFFIFIQ
jgi:hypothetical protein